MSRTWTKERRERFARTMVQKRLEKSMPNVMRRFREKNKPVMVTGYKDTKPVEPSYPGKLRDMTSLRSIVDYWRDRGADKIVIDV